MRYFYLFFAFLIVMATANTSHAVEERASSVCCFTNPQYSGVCEVKPGRNETCQTILNYLNTPGSVGKTYCANTTIRGGWERVACGSRMQSEEPYVVVLGIAQDAGYPHAGCNKQCCTDAWKDPGLQKNVSSLGVVDPKSGDRWLFDATPSFISQLEMLERHHTRPPGSPFSGIFLTHAHIGHYTGLMYLGRESMNAAKVPVYALPRMSQFLKTHGPWSQLVDLKNIEIKPLELGKPVSFDQRISVTAFVVPHRDEFSETAGFLVQGPHKSFIYIPDIDKWEKWNTSINDLILKSDYAFLDATFYADGEVPGRNMSEIPHPFVSETIKRLDAMPASEKGKVRFIHLNHTNPLLNEQSEARRTLEQSGFQLAEQGVQYPL